MKRGVAIQWANALRSGSYIQGELPRLRLGNEFDPLGVLCDISKQGSWEFDSYGWGAHFRALELPDIVQLWAGIINPFCEFQAPPSLLPEEASLGIIDSICDAHSLGIRFPQIASIIETNWELL